MGNNYSNSKSSFLQLRKRSYPSPEEEPLFRMEDPEGGLHQGPTAAPNSLTPPRPPIHQQHLCGGLAHWFWWIWGLAGMRATRTHWGAGTPERRAVGNTVEAHLAAAVLPSGSAGPAMTSYARPNRVVAVSHLSAPSRS
ncbi:hypothetical protein SKAU_G00301870 [Synaphobranchus kaupii]|uniref:Uncharacterized protein n=1 Tax=Synaphobranchus kaupii TaxID=118154 RepID=A0A9Q1EVX7_SYNKA|nr:hypothetical protein SKAU_G00301870 [Synaphobranchus kaupii]